MATLSCRWCFGKRPLCCQQRSFRNDSFREQGPAGTRASHYEVVLARPVTPAAGVARRLFASKGLSVASEPSGRPLVGLYWMRGRLFDLRTLGLVSPKRHGLQHIAIDLAQRVAEQFVHYQGTIWDLIGCKPRCDVAKVFGAFNSVEGSVDIRPF